MMNKLINLIKYITDEDYRFIIDANRGRYDDLSDEEYLKRRFKARLGYDLNLDNPVTFNEKLQWLKLYDRNPLYTTMVDKYAVKDYVAGIIGQDHIIPTYGVWEDVECIDFSRLPDQFVLKCTHDSQGLVICKDKSKLNIEEAKAKLKRCLSRDYYKRHREWPYKNVPHRVIAEKYLVESPMGIKDGKGVGLTDYKFHCFNGIPKVILVCKDRFSKEEMTEDFYTPDWEHLNVSRIKHPNTKSDLSSPSNLCEMIDIARTLSKNISFVRVDLYNIGGRVYFGELTFFPSSGFQPFRPNEFDMTLGKWLDLPNI